MPRFGLLGRRLSHSYSPLLHSRLGDYEYNLYEKEPEEVESFLRLGDFQGLNVTIPYKKDALRHCAKLSPAASATGCVNTVLRLPGGELYGENTDVFGFEYLVKDIPAGKTVVFGSGGASRAVRAVWPHAAVISRAGEDNYDNLRKHADAEVIVNATPVGMYPHGGECPAELSVFANPRCVVDLIYNPARTELLARAEEMGVPCRNGLAMLAAQAKKSAELFIGAPLGDNVIESLVSFVAKTTGNIVLIGMPGCGKTSVGAQLAKLSGRLFADTDELIAKRARRPVADILAQDGEGAFRDMEASALQSVCGESGLIIATGGGAVTREGNRRVMRQNAVVVYIDTPTDKLAAEGRPLSAQRGVEALARERLPLYRQWSDITVAFTGARETAKEIYEKVIGD